MLKFMAKIVHYSDGEFLEKTLYHNIVSAEVESLDRGDVSDLINWGVYANRGKISFIDRDETIKDLIENGAITDVKVYLVDKSTEVLIATMFISDYSYNSDTRQMDLELSDKILRLQLEKTTRKFIFNKSSLYNLTDKILGKGNYDLDQVPKEAGETMIRITVNCPDIKPSNKWDLVSQICTTAMLRAYSNEAGIVTFSHTSSANNKDYPIVIRSRNILSTPIVIPRRKTSIGEVTTIPLLTRNKYENMPLPDSALGFELLKPSIYSQDGREYIEFESSPRKQADGKITVNYHPSPSADADPSDEVEVIANIPKPQLDTIFKYAERPYVVMDRGVWTYDSNKIKITYGTQDTDNSQALPNGLYTPDSLYRITETNKYISFYLRENHTYIVDSDDLSGAFFTGGTISLKGDYYEDAIDSTSETETQALEITSNDFMQTDNLYQTQSYGNWYKTELEKFAGGLICCELECGFSDYYLGDGSDAKIISDNKFSPASIFRKYEIVEPYVTRNGVEVPLATYKNGNPVKFRIIGIKYHYVGIAKQILYLQEYRTE